MNLRKNVRTFALAAIIGLATATPSMAKEKMTVRGYVLDSACAFTKNLAKPASPECARACAQAGSPLVLLGEDGTVYWPIADTTPAKGQNGRLFKFAGRKVEASGQVFERGGSRAIVLEKIMLLPEGK